MTAHDTLLKPADVMARLRCSRSFVQDHKAELGARKLGRLLRFRLEDVQRFEDAQRSEVEQPATPAATAQATPTLINVYREGLVKRYGEKNPLTGDFWDAPATARGGVAARGGRP